MSRWFRHYAGMMRDEKLVSVSVRAKQPVERVVWVWGAILESAAEINDGGKYEFDCDGAAYFLRCEGDDIRAVVNALQDMGRLGEGSVVKWADRQFQSDNSTERVRKHRDKKHGTDMGQRGNADANPCNAEETFQRRSVTPPDTETETDIGVVVAREPLAHLERQLREAAGWQSESAPMLAVTGEVQALIDNGADLDLDVLPVVRAIAPKATSRTSWRFFLAAIARQRDQRIAAATIVSPPTPSTGNHHAANRNKPSRSAIFDAIHASIDRAERSTAADGSGEPGDPAESAA